MRYPAFVAEMGLPANRPKLWTGVWSGYLIAAAFAALAVGAVTADVTPYGTEFAAMLAIKLVTNTAVLVALRRGGRGALELMGLNMTADVVLMTAAIYYTGGPLGPLLAVYVIEVTVVALLSNAGITLLTAGGILVAYGTMCLLAATGVLPPTEPPGLGDFGPAHVAIALGYAAFALGVPTFLALRILRQLRDNEAVLEARTQDLIEAGKQRSVFLASVTHELRTPIHGVQGLADLVASGVYGPVTDKQKEATASIKRSAQGLLQLIDDLLALVRADVGRLEIQAGPIALRETVDQVVASVQWMLGTKRLTLATEVDDPGEQAILSDRRLIGHILVNLVANAAKFTPAGGRVIVRARVSGGDLVLEVSDNGIGIAPEKLEEIFEAFRQGDGSDERHYGGVGLGLALVKRLCDLLGGVVDVESEVNVGSTFTVRLPARYDPEQLPRRTDRMTPLSPTLPDRQGGGKVEHEPRHRVLG
jgi:signal transduction histidine kinase